MKQAYRYLSILFILFFVVDTIRADGGDVLERIVRLPKSKGTVYSLLGMSPNSRDICLFMTVKLLIMMLS